MATIQTKSTTVALMSGCALLTCGYDATAQNGRAVAAEGTVLDEVVVTATRRQERLIDVPMAVTALDGDALNGQGVTRIEEFVAKVPGFSIEQEGRTGLRLVLRGQNTGGAGASVATMVDDVVLSSATANSLAASVTSNLDSFELERIEVLRGPQGTLYGATAQGGVLKYVTKKPKLDATEGAVELGSESVRYGETGFSAKGAFNLPIIADRMALRVSGFYKDVPGYIDNPARQLDDANGGKQYGGRASILFQPTDALALRLTVAHQKEKYGSEGFVEVNGTRIPNQEIGNSFKLVSDEPISRHLGSESSEGTTTYYNAVVDYDFERMSLTSSTSYVQAGRNYLADITDFGLSFAGIAVTEQSNDHDRFNQELRVSSKGDSRFKWLVGGFYSSERANWPYLITSYNPSNPSQPLLGLLYDSTQTPEYKELSGFGDVTIPLADRFEISVGGRYTSNEQDFRGTFAASLFSGPADFATATPTTKENKFTYSIAPRFALSEAVSLYARVASGYRPGGPVPNFSPQPIPGYPTEFKSDTTTNYETGAKGSLMDGRLNFDVALYRIDWKDVQILTGYNVNGTVFFAIGNGGTARSQGLEWSFDAKPLDNVRLSWSGSYTDAELTEDAPGLSASKGARLPYVPKLSTTVSADYTASLSEALKLNVGASWAHVGARHATFISAPGFSNNPRFPGYDTYDLRIGLRWSRYAADLFVRNASDSQGLTTYRSITGFNGANGQGTIIQPRTVSLRFSATF